MRLVSALLALATATCAQVVPLGFSAGIAVQAGAQNSSLPAGVDISAGAQLLTGPPGGQARFEFAPSWNETMVHLHWDIGCTALVATSTASVGSTSHELWSARPVDGRFVVTWTPTVTGGGAASFALDLHDDGVIDATASAVIPVVLPVGLTSLRVDIAGSASGGVINGPWGSQIPYQGTAAGLLTVRFEPTHCTVSAFGSACGATTLVAVPNLLGAASLAAQCAPGSDIAIAVLGLDQVQTTLPLSPGCTLHTTPIAVLWQGVSNGEAGWSLQLPVGTGAVAFATQVVDLDVDTLSLTTSSAFWVSCQ